jgi:antitoxin ParD1/3/4
MNISLTPALEKFVQNKVATGLYNSVSEVIREALRLLVSKETISQERLDMLNLDIEEGLADLKTGKYEDGHTVMKKLIAKYE